MWVNRTEWNRLKERLEALERKRETITVWDMETMRTMQQAYGGAWGYPIEKQEIGVADLVQKILTKLGMELKFVKGHPDRVEVTERPDAAPNRKEG